MGRCVVDREIDLDKLRAAIVGSSKAYDFHLLLQMAHRCHQVSPGAHLPRADRLCHGAKRKVEMKLGAAMPFAAGHG
jgi:hypothetical protein